jgi:hypothetical protein
MSIHALERIFQRYNKSLTWTDIRNIVKAIKEEKCVFVDAANNDCIIVLINYEHIPLKLVYSATIDHKGAIVTALPLDIDEWNKMRRAHAETYNELFANCEDIITPMELDNTYCVYH